MNSIQNRTPSEYAQSSTISEQTLSGWARQGAIVSAKATHEKIRDVISGISFPRGVTPEVYLQGSYKNDTNIRGTSDVDIVIELNKQINMMLLYRDAIDASLKQQWFNHRELVIKELQRKYGSNQILVDKKCIKVAESHSTLKADVVVAFRRTHTIYLATGPLTTYDGMEFYVPDENRWVVNYPKMHYTNGVKKNSPEGTNGWYKHLVRVFKNYCKEVSVDVPSYFLECLIYNAPNNLFGPNYQTSFNKVLDWLRTAPLENFMCQNGSLSLFGLSGRQALFGPTPEQWNAAKAEAVICHLIRMRSKL